MTSANFIEEFITACKQKLSRIEHLYAKPLELNQALQQYDSYIQENWPTVFNGLNETPLTESNIDELTKILGKMAEIEEKSIAKSRWFQGIQDFMKNSLKK